MVVEDRWFGMFWGQVEFSELVDGMNVERERRVLSNNYHIGPHWYSPIHLNTYVLIPCVPGTAVGIEVTLVSKAKPLPSWRLNSMGKTVNKDD